MPRTRQQAIADAIARRVMLNTRKRFSTLHAESLEEVFMSNSNDVNEQSGSPRDSRNGAINGGMAVSSPLPITVKQTDAKDLISGEDFRSHAAQPNPLAGNDKPVRSQTGTEGA